MTAAPPLNSTGTQQEEEKPFEIEYKQHRMSQAWNDEEEAAEGVYIHQQKSGVSDKQSVGVHSMRPQNQRVLGRRQRRVTLTGNPGHAQCERGSPAQTQQRCFT